MNLAYRLFLSSVLVFQISHARTEPIQYRLSGLDEALEKNALLYLGSLPPVETSQFQGLKAEITEVLDHSLQALGYYQPEFRMNLDQSSNTLNIQITPGGPVVIRSVTITFEGDAETDRAFARLVEKQSFKQGDILNHGIYEAFKNELMDLSLSRGYFDAKLLKQVVQVYPDQLSADIEIILDSGKRYRFGEIQFGPMSPATEKILNYLLNFKQGKPFKAAKLAKLYQAIASTGYFSQIDIHDLRNESRNFQVPVFIGVTPKKDHEIETGIGFATDEGARLSVSWDKPWVNDKGHSFTNELKLSAINIELSSRYKIPAGNPLRNYYSLEQGYQKKQQEDTDSQLLTSSIHHWTKRPKNWDQDIFFRINYEDYIQGEQQGDSLLLIPGIALNRRQVKGSNGLDPKQGSSHNLKLEFSNKIWGSEADFIKLWGRTKWLTTVADQHRFIARAEQGVVWIDNIRDVPPSIRFFTGGDQSVRGFKYESISPLDRSGQLTGAQYLSAFSIEYDYEFIEKWRLATFIDTGTATNDYNDKWSTGTGIGIRWVTPLGPLKLDLAFAISADNTPWRIHFSMGPDI